MNNQHATRELEIVNRLGVHARAAARFVEVASAHQAEIRVQLDQRTANGKSIMGLMMLAASRGTRITITATGADARQSVEALAELVADRFGEPD